MHKATHTHVHHVHKSDHTKLIIGILSAIVFFPPPAINTAQFLQGDK